MKETLNEQSNKESTDKIKKEIDNKYNEYMKQYSSGFSIEELEQELFITEEEIMVIGCRIDVLEEEIKIPKEGNSFLSFGILTLSIIFNFILRNQFLAILFLVLNLLDIISILKRIKEIKLMKAQKAKIFKLKKESLYLELKIAVLNNIIMGYV